MENNVFTEDGQLNEATKEQALELIAKIATTCKGYPEPVIMFVLEAALTEQIAMYSPAMADLFTETMVQYRDRAVMLIAISEMLKSKLGGITDAASLEEALKNMRSEAESTPQE